MKHSIFLVAALATLGAAATRAADNGSIAVYSARGQGSNEALYNAFMQKTGIRIDRTENDAAGILSRLENEGTDSAADVVLLNNVTELLQAQSKGLLQPVKSARLDRAIDATLRAAPAADGAIAWYGFSMRPRVIVYNKHQVDPKEVSTYEALAAPRNKGKLCMRSGKAPSNLSLFGALIEHDGVARTRTWLKAVVANLARPPTGDDTDQIRAVAAGQCEIGVVNTFYLARLLRSDHAEDRNLARSVAVVFPNQGTWGTHVDIAGAAVTRHAKHPREAVRFLEYLASAQGQNLFANGNDEWPAVTTFKFDNPHLKAIRGKATQIRVDATPMARIGAHRDEVLRMLEQAGFD